MPGRVSSSLVINVSAGTAQAILDMEKLNAKFTDFGTRVRAANVTGQQFGQKLIESSAHGVTGVQALSGGLRVLEGGLNNNLRAAERFLANVLKLGPAAQAAFPLIGGIAFAGLLVKMGEEATKFYTTLRDGPEKSAGAFRDLNAAAARTNDEIEATNVKLENQLAKLEGRRPNTLKEMLYEARVEADKLAESLGKSISELNKILKDNQISGFQRTLDVLNSLNTGAPIKITGALKDLMKQLGGTTGQGGFKEHIDEINAAGRDALTAATQMPTSTKPEKEAAELAKTNAQRELQNNLTEAYKTQLAGIETALKPIEALQKKQWEQEAAYNKELAKIPGPHNQTLDAYRKLTDPRLQAFRPDTNVDWSRYLEPLKALRLQLRNELAGANDQFTGAALSAAVKGAEEGRATEKLDNPFNNKIAEMQKRLTETGAKLSAIGLDSAAQVLTKAMADSAEAVLMVNQKLDDQHKHLQHITEDKTNAQGLTIRELAFQIATKEVTAEWGTKLNEAESKIADQIQGQTLLNAAIGKGYDAQKTVNAELGLMRDMGAVTYNQAILDAKAYAEAVKNGGRTVEEMTLLQKKASEFATLRAQALTAEELKHAEEVSKTSLALSDQINLERALASAQADGAAAVRLARLLYEIDILRRDGKQQLIDKTIELNAVQEQNTGAAALAAIEQRVAAQKRLNDAYLKGADAVREAELANKLAQLGREGRLYTAPNAAGVFGLSPEAQAVMQESELQRQKGIIEAKISAERLRGIDQQIRNLNEAKTIYGDTVGIEMQLHELEQQRLKTLVDENLYLGSARDGVRAFFLEMQEQAKTTAAIVYDALNSALDKSSENLAKMLTEKKPKGGWGEAWGKEFQAVGTQVVQASIKSTLQTALGKAGSAFVKKDGSSPDAALWVRLAGTAGTGIPGVGTGPSSINVPTFPGAGGAPGGGLFGGGSQGGFIFSLLKMFGLGGGAAAAGTAAGGGESIGAMNMAITGLAEGGDMTPTNSYIVGERGFEIVKGLSGRVVNNAESRRILSGGGGTTVMYSIDARGAELGVENRIRQGIETSHRSAIATSVRASAERSKRMPTGGR